jgi:tetratricopeptide (TPR) repeat protein
MIALVALALAAPPAAPAAAAGARAYAAGDRVAAETHFRLALSRPGSQRVHAAARHGLANCRLAADPPDWPAALELLHGAEGDRDYPARGQVLELIATGYRHRAVADGDGRRWDARRWIDEAARWYAAHQQPADAARCRCAAAEIDLRLNRPADARGWVQPFLTDPALSATPSGGRGLHLLALACARLNDPVTAERAAGRVAAGDPAHADAQLVLAGLRQAAGDAAEATALLSAAGGPDARLRRGVAAASAGRFEEAVEVLTGQPGDDAALWLGASLVRLGRFADALTVLAPLTPTAAHLPDQVARWRGLARLGAGDPAGLDDLRRAADAADAVPDHLDPTAKRRRPEARLVYAAALAGHGNPGDAADHLRKLLDGNALPGRRDEVLARLILALGAANRPDESDARVHQFRKEGHPSRWLPLVLRQQVLNCLARAEGTPLTPDRRTDRRKRFEIVADLARADEVAADPAVRVAAAVALREAGRYAAAAEAVRQVPAAAHLRGDCLIRANDPASAVGCLAAADAPTARLAHAHALLLSGKADAARAAFTAFLEKHPADPLAPRVRLDRLRAAGDSDGLAKASGSLAAVHRAALRPVEAVALLSSAPREAGDAGVLVQYRLGLALAAAGREKDAQTVFEQVYQQNRGRFVGAAAARRAGELKLHLAEAEPPSDAARTRRRQAAEELARRADELKDQPGHESVRPHLLLTAARGLARLAADETNRAVEGEARERRKRWAESGVGPPPPGVTAAEVPAPGAERPAVELYRRAADLSPAVGAVARVEAAKLFADRGRHRAAAKLLADGGPAVPLADARLAAGDPEAALAAVDGVDDPLAADRRARLLLHLNEPAKAVTACGAGPSFLRAEALCAAGRLPEAAAEFARLTGPEAAYGSAWVAARRGKLDDAAHSLADRREGRSRLLLGLIDAARGRTAEAVATLLSVRTGDEVEWAARLEAARLGGGGLDRLFLELPGDGDWAVAAAERLAGLR